jgi:hypothetical protein
MSKRVYKFMSVEYGISNLRDGRLKLSTINDLNDPFDLVAVNTTNPQIRKMIELHVQEFRAKNGILCFSRNWDNLLLWSHYGAAHTGICLAFDLPDEYCLDVHYQPNVLQIKHPEEVDEDLVMRMLRTKHESWSYEQEVRLFVQINDPPDAAGLLWSEIGSIVELKEVIIGTQCSPAMSEKVIEALKRYGDSVKRYWAGMRLDAFLLVRQDHPPAWHSSVK